MEFRKLNNLVRSLDEEELIMVIRDAEFIDLDIFKKVMSYIKIEESYMVGSVFVNLIIYLLEKEKLKA